MQNAQVLVHIQRLAAQLQSALQTRGVIDRAVGIVMSRRGGTEGEGMARLRALSQSESQQLEVVLDTSRQLCGVWHSPNRGPGDRKLR